MSRAISCMTLEMSSSSFMIPSGTGTVIRPHVLVSHDGRLFPQDSSDTETQRVLWSTCLPQAGNDFWWLGNLRREFRTFQVNGPLERNIRESGQATLGS